ncbi:hypothetical protein ANCCAN_12812 [Ancylostoma caninum]|uniref:HAT C-terminal dimerisation domain-containing protein n=1 Tax=Ancylostoma caninum TaxID=29170 RepID=A0A368GE03_ANCCA|nr:hypothetical protein ANCCAN_12812 [Ancylostoma caninum]
MDARAKALTKSSTSEVEQYFFHKRSLSIDPYEFWRNNVNSSKYPFLKRLAIKYISVPATSAESG